MKIVLPIASLVMGLLATGTVHAQATGDPAAGEKVFGRCKACHTVAEGQPHRVGPNLHGMFGRVSGTAEGFKYSDAMKDAEITWDDATLDAYLADPKGNIPGNRMAFAGLKKPEERANVIAYLKEATK